MWALYGYVTSYNITLSQNLFLTQRFLERKLANSLSGILFISGMQVHAMMGPLPHSGGKKEKTSRDESCFKLQMRYLIVIGEGVYIDYACCMQYFSEEQNTNMTPLSERIANTKDWLTPVIL